MAKKKTRKARPSAAITKGNTKLRRVNPDDYHYQPLTETELTEDLPEELRDAWLKLRAFASSLGEQRIYTSARAIMFARRVCYMFVRPKKKHLELTFIKNPVVKHSLVKRVESPGKRVDKPSPKTRLSHVVHVIHEDQIEEPLSDWLREAFGQSE